MKVRMKISILGSVDGVWEPRAGDVVEVSDVAGAGLCAKGFAEPVAEPKPEPEKAVRRDAEKRTARK